MKDIVYRQKSQAKEIMHSADRIKRKDEFVGNAEHSLLDTQNCIPRTAEDICNGTEYLLYLVYWLPWRNSP
jgi:hypothetical protein